MTEAVPSWLRGRGNACETCVSWNKDKYIEYAGLCTNSSSLDSGEITDSRYRCHKFERKPESV